MRDQRKPVRGRDRRHPGGESRSAGWKPAVGAWPFQVGVFFGSWRLRIVPRAPVKHGRVATS